MTAAIAEPASTAGTAAAVPEAVTPRTLGMTAPIRPDPATEASRGPFLAPVPDSAPPFDDELGGPGTRAVHGPPPLGAGALGRPLFRRASTGNVVSGSVVASTALPPRPTTTPWPRPSTIRSADVPSWSSEADIGVMRTATADLPPVHRAASVLARAVIEVAAGHRPVAQLRVHCSPTVYAALGARHSAVTRALPHLLSVRVCEPADGVAEVSAVFRRSERVRALAFRLQGIDGRWRITALQVG